LAVAATGLLLFIVPGGLAILTIEYERATGALRRIRSCLLRSRSKPKNLSAP
jgi:hypothetical protein